MKQKILQFVHLTDLHMDCAGTHYGINAAERLRICVNHVAQHLPDVAFITVTGDLAERGDKASYELVYEILSSAPCPSFVTAGNHDDPEVMAHIFANASEIDLENAPHNVFVTNILKTNLFDAVFVNTHQQGCGAGKVRPEDLLLLKQRLSHPKSLLAFMHHPPFASGIASMDAIGLTNADDLLRVFNDCKHKPSGIFCGHLHRSIAGVWEEIPVWCLRSTVQQVNPFTRQTEEIVCCAEAPEYALVTFIREEGKPSSIFSQTIRFTEPEIPLSY